MRRVRAAASFFVPYFLLLTRLTDASPSSPGAARIIGRAIREECSSYGRLRKWRWIESYAVEGGGPHFLDVFELPDDEQAQRLAKAITETGIAKVEVMRATRALRASGSEGDLLSACQGRGDEVEEASRQSFPASDAPAWR